MHLSWLKFGSAVGVFATAILVCEYASAGWGSNGSSGGGSYGSYGASSYAGSSGFGSSGGRYASRGSSSTGGNSYGSSGGWRQRHHYRASSGSTGHASSGGTKRVWWGHRSYRSGSSGGYAASSGGSSGGSYGGGGSFGGSGYYHGGSAGAIEYGAPVESAPANESAPDADSGNPETSPINATDAHTSRDRNGYLTVRVPEDAEVFVNGKKTATPGAERVYISENMLPGRTYRYQVTAKIVRNGQEFSDTQSARMSAGQESTLAFDLEQVAAKAPSKPTVLTLNVPKDSKVTLGGNPTHSTGKLRIFETNLAPGETWNDYQVEVTLHRNGRELKRTQTVSIASGDQRSLTFNFDQAEVASAQ